jgi:ech hydrogenase subunit A
VHVRGIELNHADIAAAIRQGLSVVEADLDDGLAPVSRTELSTVVVLSQTLQVVRRPAFVLREMLRVGKRGVVSFPNFGHWKVRGYLACGAHARLASIPFSWYDTPNIHHTTIKDFRDFVAANGGRSRGSSRLAGLLLVARSDKARGAIVTVSAVVIAVASVFLAFQFLTGSGQLFEFESELTNYVSLGISVVLGLYIIYMGIKHQKWLAVALAVVQTAIIGWFELGPAHSIEVSRGLYVDNLSVIMALIIGIVGSGICVYAIGYMRDFVSHHADVPDRRPTFFAVMFLFLSAMFGVVFSNNLTWLLTAWEVTTVCSFVLIAYTRTGEAIKNAFLQIVMNLLGGLAFAIAVVYVGINFGTLELDAFINLGTHGAAVGLPVLLFAFAGMTKAAQMPFHSWLLGAMVAPTPTSALLHSSTMVKAGVFMLIKLSPLLGWNAPGLTVMLIGGLTFTLCSMMAITQSNAKRVLAYSTIANLGLITACAGIGTGEALWAAIFLLVFHAVSKSLMFLCVGTAEHHIGSRDIEDMDGLFVRMPRLARFMALGICGMFIAPFGMLLSKWAALSAFIDSGNIILVFLLVFGSAATFFFWAKWLGKITAIMGGKSDIESGVSGAEWSSIRLMGILTVALALFFPVVSSGVVVPYLSDVFADFSLAITSGDLYLMAAIVAFIVIVMAVSLGKSRGTGTDLPVYLAGVGAPDGSVSFAGSLGNTVEATQRNWYLESYFGEKRLSPPGTGLTTILLVAGFIMAVLTGGVI